MKISKLSAQEFRRAKPAIDYGFCSTPFGDGLVAWMDRGICYVGFAFEGHEKGFAELAHRWEGATFREDTARAQQLADVIFDPSQKGFSGLSIVLKGTDFQICVWEELLKIPFGTTTSYSRVAAAAGRPRAVRAAASAVGENNLTHLVPCHRVLRSDGSQGGYYWGLPCKKAILDWEKR